MPRKKSRALKFEFKGFVNLEFTEAQKDAIQEWMQAFDETGADSIVVLVEAQWKVGISWDDYHSAYQVSATCKQAGSKYWGYCFTLKHADVTRGLWILRYVYDSQLKEELYRLDEPVKSYDW